MLHMYRNRNWFHGKSSNQRPENEKLEKPNRFWHRLLPLSPGVSAGGGWSGGIRDVRRDNATGLGTSQRGGGGRG